MDDFLVYVVQPQNDYWAIAVYKSGRFVRFVERAFPNKALANSVCEELNRLAAMINKGNMTC